MPKPKIAVIGAGVSGMTVAQQLKEQYLVTVFEKESTPGGLLRCVRIYGSLFHTCGGHVFNSKRQDVLDWFWGRFNKEEEFQKTDRNSCIFLDLDEQPSKDDSQPDGATNLQRVPYPIENHVYLLDKQKQKSFYADLDEIDRVKGNDAKFTDYQNFGDFLRWRFGKMLYDLYFKPYNEKIWKCDLTTVPMSWMEGKLPMPTTQEMRDNNTRRIEEKTFVHSTFWSEKNNGSQYIADRLAEGLDIRYGCGIDSILYDGEKWKILGDTFDKVVFCGNIKDMVKMIAGVDLSDFIPPVEALDYHGTTSVFCEIDANPYSWIYLPSSQYECHRIICTGNFAASNNSSALPKDRITATVEFTDEISKENILENLSKIPLHPVYLSHCYNHYTYPIQNNQTRKLISDVKQKLASTGFYLTGRFADWEYYNMDVAMGCAIDLCKKIRKEEV